MSGVNIHVVENVVEITLEEKPVIIQLVQGAPGRPGKDGKDGKDGADGAAATIAVGTVTTLPAGSAATVVNRGTETDALLDFGIPKGEKGDPGGGGGGGASWGEITGNLSDQTDLQNALNAKPDEDDFAPDLPSSEYISDGLYYDRSQSRYVLYRAGQAAWSMTLKYVLSTIEALKLEDAPRDDKEYVRKNGYWAVASGGGGGGGASWGSITGTLSAQTDLQSALDLKANLTSLAPKLPTSGTIPDGIYYDSRYDLFAIYKNGSVYSRYTLGQVLYYMTRNKAEASDVYTKTQTDNLLANKADSDHTHDDRYYTETETDNLLANKANTSHTHDDRYYTETETDTLLANKSDTGHTHDDRYYTETETDNLLANKANTSHTHDDRYYTETETDALLANKANTADVYSKTEADTLLAAKANTADLGDMAAEDDAPSDDSEYVRKNGNWAVPSTAASRYTRTVTLNGVYTSESKMYTLESNGLLGVRLSGNKTGAARICDSQNNEPYLQLGLASGGYITWLPKGMRVYIYGSVDAAYFMPLN